MAALWLINSVAIAAASVLLVRAVQIGIDERLRPPRQPRSPTSDDALGLGDELAGRIPPLRPLRPVVARTAASSIDRP